MALKYILVAFNGSPSSETATKIAIRMHKKYRCHITVLLVHSGQGERFRWRNWMPKGFRAKIENNERRLESKLKNRSQNILQSDVVSEYLHWQSLFSNENATVAEYARFYDITLTGAYEEFNKFSDIALSPEEIALKSGRAILVVPADIAVEKLKETAVIAWDGKPAATRAIYDAVQLLEKKQKIDILSIEDGSICPTLPGMSIELSLARKGANVERVRRSKGSYRVADEILEYCETVGAGLLAIGAKEQITYPGYPVDSTTQYILKNAKQPVLVSS